MRLAARAIESGANHLSLSLSFDPLRLELPPLAGEDAMGGGISPAVLRIFAALYLFAELEQTGLVAIAEALTEMRDGLDIRDQTSSERLESFARNIQDWPARAKRERLFARLFGLGSDVAGTDINRPFQTALAGVCTAILWFERESRFGPSSAATEAAVRQAAVALLVNLAPRQYGNATSSAPRLHTQFKAALDILGDSHIALLVGGRGVWDTLRKMLGREAPDMGRLVDRGQSGQRLLLWLADVGPSLAQPDASRDPVRPDPRATAAAATWMRATGLDA